MLLARLAVTAAPLAAQFGDTLFRDDFENSFDRPEARAEAARFPAQASFGPTEASIDCVRSLGFAGWISKQPALPAPWPEPRIATLKALDNHVFDSTASCILTHGRGLLRLLRRS